MLQNLTNAATFVVIGLLLIAGGAIGIWAYWSNARERAALRITRRYAATQLPGDDQVTKSLPSPGSHTPAHRTPVDGHSTATVTTDVRAVAGRGGTSTGETSTSRPTPATGGAQTQLAAS